MSTQLDNPLPTPAGLVQTCLDHLRREDAFWSRLVAALQALQRALSQGAWPSLELLWPDQQQLVQQSESLRAARAGLGTQLAAMLQISPQAATIDRFADSHSPTLSRQLRSERAQLRRRAEEIRRLCRACAMFTQRHLEFMQRVFADLTGANDVVCYGPSGALQAASSSSLLQALG